MYAEAGGGKQKQRKGGRVQWPLFRLPAHLSRLTCLRRLSNTIFAAANSLAAVAEASADTSSVSVSMAGTWPVGDALAVAHSDTLKLIFARRRYVCRGCWGSASFSGREPGSALGW